MSLPNFSVTMILSMIWGVGFYFLHYFQFVFQRGKGFPSKRHFLLTDEIIEHNEKRWVLVFLFIQWLPLFISSTLFWNVYSGQFLTILELLVIPYFFLLIVLIVKSFFLPELNWNFQWSNFLHYPLLYVSMMTAFKIQIFFGKESFKTILFLLLSSYFLWLLTFIERKVPTVSLKQQHSHFWSLQYLWKKSWYFPLLIIAQNWSTNIKSLISVISILFILHFISQGLQRKFIPLSLTNQLIRIYIWIFPWFFFMLCLFFYFSHFEIYSLKI